MLLATIGHTRAYANHIPRWDDNELIAQLTGEKPVTAKWLWSQHGEHRIVLPRLLHLFLFHVTRYDLRAGALFNVIVLATVAAGMIWSALRLRTYTVYSDAFFPLALLQWGQIPVFTDSFQLQNVLSSALAGAMLCLIVGQGMYVGLRSATVAGILLILLSLCGANGLTLVPPLGLWLIYAGVSALRAGTPNLRRNGVLMLSFAGAAIAVVGLYFVGYEKPWSHPPSAGVGPSLKTSFGVISSTLAASVSVDWWPYWGTGLIAILAASVACLGVAWVRSPADHLRTFGLLMFIGAIVALCLVMGWGRSGYPDEGGYSGVCAYYGTLMLPSLCCVYFIWEIYRAPRFARFVQTSLFAVACVLWIPSHNAGLESARANRKQLEKIERDLRAGIPPAVLEAIYWEDVVSAASFEALQRKGIEPFRSANVRAAKWVPASDAPIETTAMTWEGGTGKGDQTSHLTITLPESRFVYVVRLRYAHEGSRKANFEMHWRKTGTNEFGDGARVYRREIPTGDNTHMLTILVNDSIDQIRLRPDDKSFQFRLEEVALLVPDDSGS
jgi:hypothetical protein